MNCVDDKKFVKIMAWIPDAIIDLKYFTNDNFLGKVVYEEEYDCIRCGTLAKLKVAADKLREHGYRMIIWDAYRPLLIQKLLWELVEDSRYVAPPNRGSKHNRGCAVDLTLADMSGKELEMPSKFDDFSECAGAFQTNLDTDVELRLKALQEAMTEAGFEIYKNEWWHFSDSKWQEYDLK